MVLLDALIKRDGVRRSPQRRAAELEEVFERLAEGAFRQLLLFQPLFKHELAMDLGALVLPDKVFAGSTLATQFGEEPLRSS